MLKSDKTIEFTPRGESTKVTIRRLSTGVPGLDGILGGGIPEFSFIILAGTPGCGKTTLAHQVAFTNATPQKPALYFTLLGEPVVKMLRYQQQFSFFDELKLNSAVRFINLADIVLQQNLNGVLEEIIRQVSEGNAGVVMIDSFRSLMRKATDDVGESAVQSFVHRLAQFLTSWEATTFLIGEYFEDEVKDNSLFSIADGILWLSQVPHRNSVVRKLQVIKLRGQATIPGLHTIRISETGLQAFSHTLKLSEDKKKPDHSLRLSIGVPPLDLMLGGGIPEGDSLLVAGPSGVGKTALATQFIAEGQRRGEKGVIAIFEERPEGYLERADSFGLKLGEARAKGALEILYLRPLDLSIDETTFTILEAVERIGAKRLVMDSLAGFEMTLSSGFREDFRESLYRMIGALTGAGVTILSTVEVDDNISPIHASRFAISDDLIRLQYVEIDGQFRKMIAVSKMRRGNHSKDIREYVITGKGVEIIEPGTTEYVGLSTGHPHRSDPRMESSEPGPEPKALKGSGAKKAAKASARDETSQNLEPNRP